MYFAARHQLRGEFERRARQRREDEKRDRDIAVKDADDKAKKREDRLEAERDAVMDLAATVLATDADFIAYDVESANYDTATVEALMVNEEQLKRVNEELRLLLDQAYVLPDGRRVFRTEDGTRVFDENGIEVHGVDPNEIEDWRPYWERFKRPFEEKLELTEQRDELLEYQKFADAIDAEVAEGRKDGTMTKERLEELQERRAEAAPDIVKQRVAGVTMEQDAGLTAAVPKSVAQPTQTTPRLDMPEI